MIYMQKAAIVIAIISLAFVLVYLLFPKGRNSQREAIWPALLIVAISNFVFVTIDALIVPGLVGGKDGWFEFWIFIFIPPSIIAGLLASRIIRKRSLGY